MKTEHSPRIASHPFIALLALLVAPATLYHWSQRTTHQHREQLSSPLFHNGSVSSAAEVFSQPRYVTKRVDCPGITPVTIPGSLASQLRSDDEMIGVIVRGKPRAYLVDALRDLRKCVVNDVIANRPISIVYANDVDAPRVLTARDWEEDVRRPFEISKSLNLKIAGVVGGVLRLSFNEREFEFDAERKALTDFPFARCTWETWRNAYPESDVYLGELLENGE